MKPGFGNIQTTFGASLRWTPLTLVIEDVTPTHVVMTGLVADINAVASDFTISGFTVSSLSRDGTNKILTLTLNLPVISTDVLSVVSKGRSYSVTNNVLVWKTQYQNVYNALTNKPDRINAIKQNKLVKTLVDGNIWAKLKRLYFFAQTTNNNGEALLDWIGVTVFASLAAVNPPFVAEQGFKPSAANSYINLNFIPSTDGGGIFTQNSASVIMYSRENVNLVGWDIGAYSAGRYILISPRQANVLVDYINT